jgi:hypothetical protein
VNLPVATGQFYCAGTAVPFTETDLPAALQPFVATGEEPSIQPVERNIYNSWSIRRQVHRLEKGVALQEAAEEEATAPLPPETAEALLAAHELHIGAALKQAEYSQGLSDAAYAQAAEAAAAKVTQYFVRRGGEWARAERARLKAGETCFIKRPNGETEAAGTVDSSGGLPPPEITT